ncbi:restriction endonuclease subunit S [Aliarcobacter butzleri]|uniref:restriction endonuclease subunit S n=3 Tax=Aliarcobacter butzleri TaxID=28197 RepID=UPI0021B4215F|nr:restriction endonuclease subunit S [Aliarcobacter butzleri]MCT7585587.1 restriction endonuclease subunit S [Aliarcobacter butzleri]
MKYRIREQNELKPSGVEWLGDIPKDWQIIKLKYLAKIITGYTPSMDNNQNYSEEGMTWVKPDNLNEFNYINDSKEKISTEAIKKQNVVTKDSILVCCIGSIGKFGIAGKDLLTNQQINSLVFNKSINKYFSKYMIFSSKQEHNRMANGNVVQILNSTSQSNIYFATPNLLEQQKIANFLDEKSKIFDEAISKKEQLISKLELAKQSLISEVVTGKLKVIEQNSKLQTIKREKNELKSSGVEWLGDIPKDWQVKKLKYLVNNLNNRRIPIESSIRGNMKNSIYDYYGATGIIDKVDNYIFDEPTIVLAEDGANLIFRNIKLVYLADGKYWVNNHAHILSTKDNSSRIYLYHLLEIYDYLPIISGSAQPKLTKESLMNISLPYPSLEEQQKISKYLDEKLIHFDNTIEKTKQSITKLKEAKEALISQAVTGKIEVL